LGAGACTSDDELSKFTETLSPVLFRTLNFPLVCRKLLWSNFGTSGCYEDKSPWGTQVGKAGAVTFVIALFLLPLTVLTFCLAVEVMVGLRPTEPRLSESGANWRAVVIVPAHDEAEGLARSLDQMKVAAAVARAQILVVADNCADSTAEIARGAGVDVIERHDQCRRGKGFALDFAREHLANSPPEIVVIVDADCRIDGASLATLVEACGATGRPCQATNVQRPPSDASPAVQLSTFAFFVKNVIRQRGLQRLAGRAHLLGTGMALPWPIFARARLATSNIVEDLALGQELSGAGHAPLFIEAATIWSNAETESNTLSQRRRWEGGFLQNAVRVGPAMFGRSLARGDMRGIWAAINTMIPPVALLVLIDLATLLLAAVLTMVARSSMWPIAVLSLALICALAALGLAWRAGGSRFVTLRGLARIPFYLLWKLPMYFSFARHGAPKEWQRTDRT
jgi:cellulose synthase/poly-beta-1,6-N-acetylglucosamine synthase-like glycosyltransferase